MKTIRRGESVSKNLVGRKIECKRCHFVGELQEGDKVRRVGADHWGGFFEADCPNCGSVVEFATRSYP